MMIDYSLENSPLQKELSAGKPQKPSQELLFFSMDSHFMFVHLKMMSNLDKNITDEVGNTAAFLASPLASAITGAVIYVDNGLNAMGVGVDSPIFKDLNIPKAN